MYDKLLHVWHAANIPQLVLHNWLQLPAVCGGGGGQGVAQLFLLFLELPGENRSSDKRRVEDRYLLSHAGTSYYGSDGG